MFNSSSKPFLGNLLRNRRERFLAIVLIVAVALGSMYRVANTGLGLWNDESLTIDRLSSDITRLQEEIEHQERAMLVNVSRQATSLPADSVLAATRYYAWLHDMAGRHGMAEIKIDNTAPMADAALGSRIHFSLQARSKLDRLGEFIEEFQGYSLLSSITHLQIQDYSPLAQEVRVQLTVEALCLSDAMDTELPVPSTPASDGMLVNYLADNNPFRRYEPPKPVTAATVAAVPVVDPLSKVAFVGVVQRDGDRQAWFYDSLNNNEVLLKVGSQISVGEFSFQLDAVEESNAFLVGDNQRWSIRLGQSLRAALGDPQ